MKTIRIFAVVLMLSCLLTGCNLFGGNTATLQEANVPAPSLGANASSEKQNVPVENSYVLKHVTILSGDAPGEVTPAEITAANELTEYLEKRGITVATGGFPITITIDTTLGDDSYRIDAVTKGENAGMTIKGGNGNALERKYQS